MPVVKLRVRQRQANLVDDILNIFHYLTLTDVDNAPELTNFINQWILDVQPAILAFQTDQIVYLDLHAEVIGGLAFADISQGSVDGDISGDPGDPYSAYEFIYHRATRSTRNGFKRFAGVDENSVDQGGNVSGTVAGALTAAEPVLSSDVTTTGAVYTPVIYGAPTGPPNNLPERVNAITSVAFHRVSSQNSRKPWR